MKTAAVILAGGRGTRSVDPGTAKIAQEIGGKSLLQWHLEILNSSSIDEVIVVTAHLADQVRKLAESLPSQTGHLRLVNETNPQGTFPAVRIAMKDSDADRFLVILGDIWSSFPVDHFLQAWDQAASPVAAIVHPSLHPQDSDAVIPGPDGFVGVVPKQERGPLTRNMSATGIFGLSRDYIEQAPELSDIGSQVLFNAAQEDRLFAHVDSHYFKDTGTPERLQQAREDWLSGTFARRGSTARRPAVLLDRDGVLNPTHPEVYRAHDLTLIDGVAEAIAHANAQGVPVLVATNQPGLAKGFMTFDEHEAIRARLDALLMEHGAFVDDYAFCPHHPDTGFPGERAELKFECSCRKPAPGLLQSLVHDHHLDPNRIVMVGDSDRDEQAAVGAEVSFLRVHSSDEAALVIRSAVERVTC